jgi:non-ribosomal peptide synthase protein (TIGR01720 family)
LTAAWFRYPAGEPPRLLLVAHHLGIDAVSWTPLLQDLERALGPGEVRLPPKTASFQEWARGLAKLAVSAEVSSEARRWLDDDDAGGRPPLPARTRDGVKPSDVNLVGSAETVEAGLTEEATRALLTDAPAALGADAPSLLVSAFSRALAAWSRQEHVVLDVEGHGRGDVLEGIDVSRTAGWFTAIYPVSIPVKLDDEPGAAARAAHAVLHGVPRGGLPFGLARYLAPDSGLTRRLRALPRAEVAFNYLGHLDAALGSAAAFRPCQAPIGPSRSPKNRRAHLLEVNGGVLGGRLRMELTYGREIHDRAEIEALARRFESELAALVGAARAAPPLTRAAPPPSNEFGWSPEDLDELLSGLEPREGS